MYWAGGRKVSIGTVLEGGGGQKVSMSANDKNKGGEEGVRVKSFHERNVLGIEVGEKLR